jgi:hypothetical protein
MHRFVASNRLHAGLMRRTLLVIGFATMVAAAWPEYEPLTAKPGWFASVGNHRFTVELPPSSLLTPVVVTADWRRSDADPLKKAVYLKTSTNQPVACSFVGAPNADSATFSFAPVDGEHTYFIYYMPFKTCEYAGGACIYNAQALYDPSDAPGSCSYSGNATVQPLVATYEARAQFESFEPMEMPMTAAELSGNPQSHVK